MKNLILMPAICVASVSAAFSQTTFIPGNLEVEGRFMGAGGEALGAGSFAWGYYTYASGNGAVAVGDSTSAYGYLSFAAGSDTKAHGNFSVAMGYGAESSGDSSIAFNEYTYADSFSSMTSGRYNVGGGNSTVWVETDPLFEIGNGSSYSTRSNALTVYKNGNTDLNGNVQVQGSITSQGPITCAPGGDIPMFGE